MRTFRDAIRHDDLVVTTELPLDRETGASAVRDMVTVLAPFVDAVQIGDDRYGAGHMSALAAASITIASGLDAVISLSCRDRNRIALQADILGARALGVTSLVLSRGEKLQDRSAVRAKGVFEIGATNLIRMANELGSADEYGSGFYIGAPVTVFDPAEDWEATRIREKLDAGVRFLRTQPCLNAELVRRYVDRLVQLKILHRASLVVEVPLLASAQEAMALKEVHQGAPIPDATIKRIASADDPVREGMSACVEILAELRSMPGISGVNIHCRGDLKNVVAAIREGHLAD